MGIGVVLFGVIVYGIVTAGSPSSDGSNTRNAVTQGPELPEGVQVEVNRRQSFGVDGEPRPADEVETEG